MKAFESYRLIAEILIKVVRVLLLTFTLHIHTRRHTDRRRRTHYHVASRVGNFYSAKTTTISAWPFCDQNHRSCAFKSFLLCHFTSLRRESLCDGRLRLYAWAWSHVACSSPDPDKPVNAMILSNQHRSALRYV